MFNLDSYLSEFKHHIKHVEDKYNNKLDLILERLNNMSVEMDTLTAQVKSNSDLLDSATALINGIAARITAAGVDPAALTALTTELKAKDDVLAAAVVANTPAVAVTPGV